ncbi:MAG: tetratricopeptide repeat protein [Pseudomonadota bacterium]
MDAAAMFLSARLSRPTLLLVSTVALAALAGCNNTDRTTTGSIKAGPINPNASQADIARSAEYWGARYSKNPRDKQTGLSYAQALRLSGRTEQAIAVMRQMVIFHPEDNQVLAAFGKAQADGGQLKAALSTIRRAQRDDQPDWKLLSAEGAIHDQLGDPASARNLYRKALDIKPADPGILSNLGMSYVLEGDLRTAETYMRDAIRQPGADGRVRQNLALVVGLQGRFEEAEKIASSDLSPEQASQNIAFLRSTLKQQNAWKKLSDEG